MYGVYVHLPFCERKCPYCSFYSKRGMQEDHIAFVDALERELLLRKPPQPVDTVFIGGGSPTCLEDALFDRLLYSVGKACGIPSVCEWTVESNPSSWTDAKETVCRQRGVTRISMGIQSFQQDALGRLGRRGQAEDALHKCHHIMECGYFNLNIDLMYGVPTSPASWLERDLSLVASLRPHHVSSYCLSLEKGVPLYKKWIHEVSSQDYEVFAAQQFESLRNSLKKLGYHHYEISNFALPGHECRHNMKYWCGGEFAGYGPSAHEHVQGVRSANIPDIKVYETHVNAGRRPHSFSEKLGSKEKAREVLITWLRLVDGVPETAFIEKAGYTFDSLAGSQIRDLQKDGLLIEEAGRLKLSERAHFISDTVFRELV